MKKNSVFISLFTFIFWLVLCVPLLAAVPQKGGALTYAQPGSVETLDPPYANDNMSEEVNMMIFDNLLQYTPDLKIKGQLAQKWEASSDGMTWTFWLRKGVKFHDETDLDAEAVKFNFDRWIGPEKPFKAYGLFGRIVKSVDLVDKYTIKLHMIAPFSSLPNYLCHPAAAIESPAQLKKYGREVSRNPSGSGPFKFKEWVKGDHLTLVRNENYWDGAPYLDAVVVRPVTEEATRIMQLQTGQLQAATNIPPEILSRLRDDAKLNVVVSPTNVSLYVIINNQKKPLTDVRVRQALNYAIDKEAIVKDLFKGMASPLSGVNAPIVEGAFQPKPYEYNPAKAKKLLAEAGYPDGFTLAQWSSSGRIVKDVEVSQLIQKYLGAVGVKTQLQVMEWVTFENENRQPPDKAKFDIYLMKWAPSTGEARWQLFLAWTRENWPPGGSNRALYSNPEFDKLVELGTRARSQKLRNEYFQKAQTLVTEDAAYIPICSPHSINVTSKKLHDFVFSPLEHAYATNKTWLEK
jgi:ABC-type transport system substrate-binding protein